MSSAIKPCGIASRVRLAIAGGYHKENLLESVWWHVAGGANSSSPISVDSFGQVELDSPWDLLQLVVPNEFAAGATQFSLSWVV